jgi:hypothetical protein
MIAKSGTLTDPDYAAAGVWICAYRATIISTYMSVQKNLPVSGNTVYLDYVNINLHDLPSTPVLHTIR